MTDSADWLPYAIVRSQPAASIVLATSLAVPTSGVAGSVLIAGVANRQIRILRLELRDSTTSPCYVTITSTTGATVDTVVPALGYRKLIDEVPMDWPIGESVTLSGNGVWADAQLDISGLYVTI